MLTTLYSPKYNQQDASFSRSIYFYRLLYMFQAFSPPIIRSTKLYIQRQVLSNKYCCLLLSWMRWNGVAYIMTVIILILRDEEIKFDVHISVHRKYISKVQPIRCNVFSLYLFL